MAPLIWIGALACLLAWLSALKRREQPGWRFWNPYTQIVLLVGGIAFCVLGMVIGGLGLALPVAPGTAG